MKFFTFFLVLSILFGLYPNSVDAQRMAQQNEQKLLNYSKALSQEYQTKHAQAIEYAKRNNIPIVIETEKTYMELQYFTESGVPMYFISHNVNAAASIATTPLHPGGTSGLNLDGSGIVLREWDGGSARTTHQELTGRVTIGDGTTTTHYHATHVAGTMIGAGTQANAKGMAPGATLRSFKWDDDQAEMASEAANGALISNHSYGYGRGWTWTGFNWAWYGDTSISNDEDYKFGFYDNVAQGYDQIARDAPYYLICKSAGNDRGDGPSNGAHPQDGPYDCIGADGIGKNILTIAAVNDIAGGYTQSSDVVISSFSSWGPADDGRIKPDISANGVGLYSASDGSDTEYKTLSGTSMSSPSVAGSLALLQQHYHNLNGEYMKAATLKALALQTADEAGATDGPDYIFGWGLMNTQRAAEMITKDQTSNIIKELSLSNGATYQETIQSDGSQKLKIAICWTDVPGTPTSNQLDPSDPMLVNDLDLRIVHNGTTSYPWKLNKDNPQSAATRTSENNVDNVEIVEVITAAAGDYTIIVDHDGTLNGGSQAFSLIIGGVENTVTPLTANFSASATNITTGGQVTFSDQSTGNPTSWQWTFAGGTPATSTDQNPVVTYAADGTYDVQLTVSNGSTTNTKTNSGYITVASKQYCESKGNNANYEWIEKVVMGSFTKTSGSSGSAGYSDFTSDNIPLTIGQDYNFTLTPGFSGSSYNEYWKIWIDFNNDKDFDDTNELLYSSSASKVAVSSTISIPADVLAGTTRMRVTMKYASAPTPCETFSYGEVEDYTVTLSSTESVLVATENGVNLDGDNDNWADKLVLSPNPVKETIYLNTSLPKDAIVSVIDNQGKIVIHKKKPVDKLNVQHLATGTYLLKINVEGKVVTKRFIKR